MDSADGVGLGGVPEHLEHDGLEAEEDPAALGPALLVRRRNLAKRGIPCGAGSVKRAGDGLVGDWVRGLGRNESVGVGGAGVEELAGPVAEKLMDANLDLEGLALQPLEECLVFLEDEGHRLDPSPVRRREDVA